MIVDLRWERSVRDSLKIENLRLKSDYFYRRVSPGERDLTSSDGDPGTNGVISKLAAEGWIKRGSAHLQAAVWLLFTQHRVS